MTATMPSSESVFGCLTTVYAAQFSDGLWRVVTVISPFKDQDSARSFAGWILSADDGEKVTVH